MVTKKSIPVSDSRRGTCISASPDHTRQRLLQLAVSMLLSALLTGALHASSRLLQRWTTHKIWQCRAVPST